jgi:replicative DNA helicase
MRLPPVPPDWDPADWPADIVAAAMENDLDVYDRLGVSLEPDERKSWRKLKAAVRRRLAERNGHVPVAAVPPSVNPAYTDATVTRVLAELASARPGTRNTTLNNAALRCARLLPADAREWLREQLITACYTNGLVDDDGLRSVEATIDSAFSAADLYGPAAVPEPAVRPPDVQEVTTLPNDPAPEPIPLTRAGRIPPFPVDELPKPVADMVHAVAEATQTDPAMPATAALSALSACTGGHARIEIRSGWREPLHLYTATIALSGERKSAVQQPMVAPLLDTEEQLAEKAFTVRLEAEARQQVAIKAAERQRNIAASSKPEDRDEALADAIGAAKMADEITVPPIPRLVADDITPEAATSLLAEQGGRLAVISAEGGIFDIVAGRYSRLPNLDLWLKGHSGDPVRVDRKGRPPEYVRHPAITLGLMIQPQVLATVAENHEFRGRGLLARILYAYPKSKVGRRQIPSRTVDPVTAKAYGTVVAGLAAGMAGWSGDPAVLMLTPAAHEAMVMIERAVEPTLAGDGELATLADWGAKYAGAVARIAGILHLAEYGSEVGPRTPVDAQTILAASRIGAYFKACAINAFAEMGTDRATADVVYLLERIERLGNAEVSERDIHTAARSRFPTKVDLRPSLDRLIDHGYLVPQPPPESTGGRPASPRYRVRTSVQKAHNTQKAGQ